MACPVCPTCPKPMPVASNGAFQGDNPTHFALPLLIIQVSIVLTLTRFLAFLLRPLRQPRVIAEMIGGILLGPSAFGRNTKYLNTIFPKRSITVLDTLAQIGLIFFLFMVGMELDLKAVRKTGKVAVIIAAAGITVPFAAGVGVSIVLHATIAKGSKTLPFIVFMGVAMSITAFPVLARILAERKLLTTDVGQMAMSAAAVNDVVAWILLALAIALSGSGNKSPIVAVWVLLCGVAFVLLMFLVVKPFMEWIVNQHGVNAPMRETHICITLGAVLAAGFVTDVIGIHAIFGAFIFGLVVPKEGHFASTMTEKLEDIVTILMLPLYFAASGLKTDIHLISGGRSGGLLILVIAVACGGKILGTFVVARLNKMEIRKALTLGFLMNTKGLVELIVLNIGLDKGVLNDEVFTIMVIMALFTTFMTTPVVVMIYKPARNPIPYTERTLDMDREKELRMLACIRGKEHVQALVNLTEAARGTRKRAIRLYILHLVQMSERASDILLVQRARKDGLPYFNTGTEGAGGEKDEITIAFQAYAQLSKVTVRPMTAISRFEDMHEDVCITAADKRVSLLILPFHKHQASDGLLDHGKAAYRSVNQHILDYAPCSVAIVVNRGLGEQDQIPPGQVDHFALVLFFGGPDDREALSLGCRMAEHPGVKLKIVRFLPDKNAEHVLECLPEDASTSAAAAANPGHSRRASREILKLPGSPTHVSYVFRTSEVNLELEKRRDEDHLEAAKHSNPQLAADGSPSVQYEEHLTSNAMAAAKEFGKREEFDLILVGSCRTPCSLVVQSAGHVQEFAELGPIGDVLTSELHGPPTKATVIVIQQYNSAFQKS